MVGMVKKYSNMNDNIWKEEYYKINYKKIKITHNKVLPNHKYSKKG